MTFAAPWMLWSLAALAPLLGLYLLKVRPRRREVTAYFLWAKVFQENRASSLWSRLRDIWSLLVMAIAFALIALALAQPRLGDTSSEDLLIVIDNSASMQADDGGTSRLELAKRRAADLARALDGKQRAAVATAASQLRYLSHLTDNPRELLAAIEQVEPTNERFNLACLPAAPLASPNEEDDTETEEPSDDEAHAAPDQPRSRTLLVSDGAFGKAELATHVELLKVGSPADNAGIVAADAALASGSAGQLSLFVQVASSAEEPTERDLVVSYGEDLSQIVKVVPLTIEPGANRAQVFTIENAQPGPWLVELDGDDALAADNRAYLVARRPEPVRVSVAAENRFFFERSVAAFSNTELLQLVDSNEQIVLCEGLAADAERVIVFHPQGESPWWSELGEELDALAPEVLIEEHPIIRHLDATTIRFTGARRLAAPAGSQTLVAADDGTPLVYVARNAGRSAVVVNLDPQAAEFFFSAWFPVLVHSAATHLADRGETPLASYAPGMSAKLPGESPESLAAPDKTTIAVSGDRFDQFQQLGFYGSREEGAPALLSSSLLAKDETLLDNASATETSQPIASGRPLAYWLTLLAIGLLTGESLLYHRRKVG